MKKKILAIMLVAAMALSVTACGNAAATDDVAAEDEYSEEAAADDGAEEAPAEEAPAEEAPAEEAATSDFTLGDVTADLIQTSLYAQDVDTGAEIVFTMFTTPSGKSMASLFAFNTDGTGDVFCGEYTIESETDENGIAWSKLEVGDVYTGATIQMGFAESTDACYITNPGGSIYSASYLSADQAVVYMGTAAALLG